MNRDPWSLRVLTTVVFLFGWTLLGPGALAHWADLAVAEINIAPRETRVTLTYPTGLTAFADDNHDGALSYDEIIRHSGALRVLFAGKVRVLDGTQVGVLEVAPVLSEVALPANVRSRAHTTLALIYRFSASVTRLSVRYDLFLKGVNTASCLATVLHDGRVQNVVFTPEQRDFRLERSGAVDLKSFVLLGFDHIVTGYDHLLFLLSLLALGGGLRYLLKVVTAFTIAHSVTLALTVLGVIVLPARLIESGIALSIVYVAAENLFRRDSQAVERSRWIVTFVFGLLHGMGFAELLRQLDLPRANLPVALVGFNVGVELGQLSVVLPVFALLFWLGRTRMGAPVRWTASVVAVAAGLVWFVQRAFLTA